MRKRWNQPGGLFASPRRRNPAVPAQKRAGFHPLYFFLGIFRRLSTVIGGLVLIGLIVSLLSSSALVKQQALPDKMILTLRLKDGLIEQDMAGDILDNLKAFGESHLTVSEIVSTLDKAAHDSRVKGLAFSLEGGDFGAANVQEIRAALKRFKTSGKPAWVFSPSYAEAGGTMGAYYLASAFDQIWLQPVGFVSLPGYDAEMPFMADALKKIGIKPEFLQRKEYKSVMENLSRNGMSPENREMMASLLNDIITVMVKDIANDRKQVPGQINKDIDQALFTDQEALKAGLIDHIDYGDVLLEAMRKTLGAKPDEKDMKTIDMVDYHDSEVDLFTGPKVGLISAVGEIVSDENGGFGKALVTPEKIVSAFQEAIDNPDIKTIVFRIASPGGSPTASETIRRAVQKAVLRGKPVIVSMGSMAGSGGYWIGTDATRIFALPATLTGSIGVAGGKVDTSELMKKLEVNWDGVQVGKNADMNSMTKPFSPSALERMNAMMDSIYAAFIDRVSRGRKLSPDSVEKIAKGRVWTGQQALANGLVDEMGGLDTALDYAAKTLGVADRTKLEIIELPHPKSMFEQILGLFNIEVTMNRFAGVLMGIVGHKVEQAATAHVSAYDPFLEQRL